MRLARETLIYIEVLGWVILAGLVVYLIAQ